MNLVNEGVLPPDELDDRDERREEQELARSRETVADIVAAMRAMARVSETFVDRFSNPCLRTMMEMEAKMRKSLADRLEAAAKRDEERAVEHATRHAEAVARDNCRDCVHNPNGKNYEGGNEAAMREACQNMLDLLMLRGDGKVRCVLTWDEFNESQKMLRIALSAPPRNCDRFSSADEAIGAYRQTHKNMVVNVFLDWLFAPAAERKGEGDGSK